MGKGLRPPVGDPDPTTKVADIHKGYHKHRGWGRGRRLVDPNPRIDWNLEFEIPIDSEAGAANLRPDPTSMVTGIFVGACNLSGGVRVADRRPRPPLSLFQILGPN
ncbi:hypothetical protein CDL15_Pgr013233 [Punica granatum]|uniref:Uncharacterized protein n=1 Tax=Punica granatum TaxID=22663 RepID=A0A218WPC2_PUNGR|nr:hypothetical protein CDL15_Pgr013232 [Punica granatum]OWM74329.1 hypothetical protein CDL15_Pgr013233 [Punica granatum]PKI61213.1 hypothetical protein CRG98_018361 [Punica granatum]